MKGLASKGPDRNQITSLHSAVRRYCLDGIRRWRDAYSKLPNGGRVGMKYTAESYQTFPRYIVLEAILSSIEAIVPDDFESLDDLRSAMVYAGTWAESTLSRGPEDCVQAESMTDERRQFVSYVRDLDASALVDSPPLFQRRTLRPDEVSVVWREISERWHIDRHYWYPLSEKEQSLHIEAFHVETFESEVGLGTLRTLLASHGVSKVLMINEGGDFPQPSHEIELSYFEPVYSGSEWYCTAKPFDWIIYVSHEESITVGGWLLDEVRLKWPAWQARTYKSPFEG